MITTDLYPEGGDISQAAFWTVPGDPGWHPPIVGATRYHNLFLNWPRHPGLDHGLRVGRHLPT